MSDPYIIDAWAQLPQRDEHMPPEAYPTLERAGTEHVLASGVDPDDVVQLMDAHGVAKLMVCGWYRPGGPVISNDEVAAVVARHPDRFVGVAGVALARPIAAVRELERAVGELGFKALRLLPWLRDRLPNHRLYYALYAKCVELGIPFCTQAGHTGPRMPSEPGRPVPHLDQVALDFPDLEIVAGHIGYSWTEEMIGVAWKHDNVYIDTSAWAPRHYPPALLHYLRTYGQDKVLFGTNFPQMQLEPCVTEALALDLPDDVREKFFSANAQRVFGLE